MLQARVRVEDIEGLDAQFEEVVQAIEANLEEVAATVRDAAKTTSAFTDRSGALRRSIGMRKSRKTQGAYTVYATAPHASLIEYGHVKILWGHPTGGRVAARPFMRQALTFGIRRAVELFRQGKK